MQIRARGSEYVSEFKYLGLVLGESNTYDAECRRKVAIGRKVALGLQLECAINFHKKFLVHVLMYGSETMLWKEKKSRIRTVCWELRE